MAEDSSVCIALLGSEQFACTRGDPVHPLRRCMEAMGTSPHVSAKDHGFGGICTSICVESVVL